MPESPYVKDPLNPTDAELAAAIQRGLANGTILDARQFLEKAALPGQPDAEISDDPWADTEADAHANAEVAAEIMAHDLTTMLDEYGMEPGREAEPEP